MSLWQSVETQLIFPGSLRKTSETALRQRHVTEGLAVQRVASSYGQTIGILIGEPQSDDTPACRTDEGVKGASLSPLILYFYGNGSGLDAVSYEFNRFRELGAQVVTPEYIGYGMSSGVASELGCYAAADDAYLYATQTLKVPVEQIVICGHSLGAAVAIDLAARRQCAALIILSAFTSLYDIAHDTFPWAPLPLVQLITGKRFNNQAKLSHVTSPIFIGHGKRDSVIPYSMSQQLSKAAQRSDRLTLLLLEECGHNDIFDTASLWEALQSFVQQWVPRRGMRTSDGGDAVPEN